MIFRNDVEKQSRFYLETYLKSNPSALSYLTQPHMFNKWVELLHFSCNELELLGVFDRAAAMRQVSGPQALWDIIAGHINYATKEYATTQLLKKQDELDA